MRSGATSAERCRPVSPPAVRKISSVHVSGASARGRTQWAWIFASSQGGPSGSAASTTTVRDGCRPVSREIVSAARAPDLGLARDHDQVHHRGPRRDVAPAGLVAGRVEHQVRLRPDPGELLLDVVDRVGRRRPADRRLAGLRRVRELHPPAARRARADRDDLAVLARAPGAAGLDHQRVPAARPIDRVLRSGAIAGPRGRAGRPRPPGPRCRPRSSGSRAGRPRPRPR